MLPINVMKANHYWLFAIAVCLCQCETTSDPSVDSIGFSPKRAERERLEPRRRELARLKEETAAEQIESRRLKLAVGDEERALAGARREQNQVNRTLTQAQSRQNRIKRALPAAQQQQEDARRLIQERDHTQQDVDDLSEILLRQLESH